MYWESCSSPNFETTVSQLAEVPAYRLRLRSTSVAPSRDLGHTVQQRSASGLEGGPFRAVLLNLGLLERRQIPEGEARGLRSGLLRRAAAVGRRAKTPLEFPVSFDELTVQTNLGAKDKDNTEVPLDYNKMKAFVGPEGMKIMIGEMNAQGEISYVKEMTKEELASTTGHQG